MIFESFSIYSQLQGEQYDSLWDLLKDRGLLNLRKAFPCEGTHRFVIGTFLYFVDSPGSDYASIFKPTASVGYMDDDRQGESDEPMGIVGF